MKMMDQASEVREGESIDLKKIESFYGELAGNPIDKIDFYLVFGVFRLAVIAQQIYYRYYHGQTRDQRFKPFIAAVNVLDRVAKRFMGRCGY